MLFLPNPFNPYEDMPRSGKVRRPSRQEVTVRKLSNHGLFDSFGFMKKESKAMTRNNSTVSSKSRQTSRPSSSVKKTIEQEREPTSREINVEMERKRCVKFLLPKKQF